MGSATFNQNTRYNATLYVPTGTTDKYKAKTGWKTFKFIEETAKPKVSLNMSSVTIEKGKTLTLKATVTPKALPDKSVIWTSSNTKIATVTSAGKVKGIKAGTAIITCTSNATGLTTTCTVTVKASSGSRSVDGDDDDVTGIETLQEKSDAIEPFDVYDLSGHKVLQKVTSLDGLPEGIYIVNGKKMLKKYYK